MKLSVSSGRLEDHPTPLLIIPIIEGNTPLPFQKDVMKGEAKKLYLLYEGYKKSEMVLLVGLGKKEELNLETLREGFGLAARKARELKVKKCSLLFKNVPGIPDKEVVTAMAEGFMLGSYSFDKYKTIDKNDELQSCTVVTNVKDHAKAVENILVVCDSVTMVRDMINENADVMTTTKIAQIAKTIAKHPRIKIKIIEKDQLEKLGCNLILSVGRGSRYPPKMIVMEYNGNKFNKDRIAIVGKGITYDSGGINLKPTGYIETMKQDMGGAATVMGVIKAVAELKLKANVITVVPTCENMIGPNSYKPGEVITSYSGKTVEIENTDAEGRLILADAITYAERNLKTTQIIDIATLTGSAAVIFGEYVTPMIGDGKFKKQLLEAGEKTHDRVWELPLHKEFLEETKGDISDIKNLGYNKRFAGTIMGAAFLKQFVDKVPLLHLDIGGTAWYEKTRGYIPKYATGAGTRLLIEFFREISH